MDASRVRDRSLLKNSYSCSRIGNVTTKIETFVASCDRVFTVLDEPQDLADKPDAVTLPIRTDWKLFSSAIEFL
ncbi:hypothetical protein H6S82_21165 [Planktothrix sp. FACHB-1355]|uniref:Uncharacterized protein n=1 Tax=Aerosakkonema funiforme FACHB-1375 TaxID=2949571 RepID=A0A926VB59_9CYAN|nr:MULTISPECIES: hypothetical protein [Oscillatoriales]MBD2180634.1 hypothetical protein [Aerosakkonema funiforme FACHB-1375]MBD3561331.1 hypothetical protein [Planktothrix sp. FACHB-1355]